MSGRALDAERPGGVGDHADIDPHHPGVDEVDHPQPARSVDAPTLSAGARISGSDEFLRQVLLDAELPAVLPALAQATGDLRLVDPALRPPGGPIGAVPLPQGRRRHQN